MCGLQPVSVAELPNTWELFTDGLVFCRAKPGNRSQSGDDYGYGNGNCNLVSEICMVTEDYQKGVYLGLR